MKWHNLYLQLFQPLFIIIALNLFISNCSAQDSLMINKAIQYTVRGNHEKAKEICMEILKKDPYQASAGILFGRLYSWDHQFDSARTVLQRVISIHPGNEAALNALINVELWSNHPGQALIYCNKALILYPLSEKFQLKKAKAFSAQKKHDQAQKIIEGLLSAHPDNREAEEFLKYLRREEEIIPGKNGAGLSFIHDSFSKDYSSWNYVSVYLFHKGKKGAISGNINYANRFNTNGLQYELSLYPKISRVMHAYINAGYSSALIFPNYNFSASLYYKIFRKSELELGARYLNFIILPAPIIAYTGSVSTRYRRFWVSLRPYIIPQRTGTDQSYNLTVRYYLLNPKNSISLTLNTGVSPREYFDPALNHSFKLNSKTKRVQIDFQTTLFSTKNVLKTLVGYERRVYPNNVIRNRITVGTGLERLF